MQVGDLVKVQSHYRLKVYRYGIVVETKSTYKPYLQQIRELCSVLVGEDSIWFDIKDLEAV